jgi:hypothetical protein
MALWFLALVLSVPVIVPVVALLGFGSLPRRVRVAGSYRPGGGLFR